MIFFQANSEDPDETPHYVASHLGLRFLTMSHLWNARLKWVKIGQNRIMQKLLFRPFINACLPVNIIYLTKIIAVCLLCKRLYCLCQN